MTCKVEVRAVAKLELPTGKIVAGPVFGWPLEPFTRKAPSARTPSS